MAALWRWTSERPRLSKVTYREDVPVIDLSSVDKSQIIRQIGDACRSYGFFQAINHGVALELGERMLRMAEEFFNVKEETGHNWRDYIRLRCYPLEDYVHEWPTQPLCFKEVVSTYCQEARRLGIRLLQEISESLGLEQEYIENVLAQQGQMAIKYHPPCPEPGAGLLTYGLTGHTNPYAITIHLQNQRTADLQVLKDGEWLAINPHLNAFLINVGDQLQALSNGQYKSVWHRETANSDEARISVALSFCPASDAVIEPVKELADDGSEVPALYRSFSYYEYFTKFQNRNSDEEVCLELFRN